MFQQLQSSGLDIIFYSPECERVMHSRFCYYIICSLEFY
jgi:hypothetical protein